MFNPVYLKELKNYKTRWNFYYGSAGSGKSVFIAQKLVIKALESDRRVLILRRYGTTLRQSVYQLFKDCLRDFKVLDHCRVIDSNLYIQLPNGSEFIFMGLDDEQKLLSIQDISDVFVEEATETSRDMLEQLSLRLRGKADNHQIHLAFNPVSKLNFMYDFMEVRPPKDMMKMKTTYRDNIFLPDTYIEALEDLYRTNPRKAKVYCDGNWGALGRLVFEENYLIREFDPKQLVQETRGIEPRFGGDFGFSLDPTAIIGTLYHKEAETIYVLDEIYKKGMSNIDIRRELLKKQWHKQMIFFDCSDPKSINELNRMGMRARPCKKGKDSILFGVSFLQRHKIVIHSRCKYLINEFTDYQYRKDRKTGLYNMEKFEGSDHAIDALRYAYSDYYQTRGMRSLKKIYFGV